MRAVLGAQQTEDTCREGESPGLPDPLLDARVSSVQRNSAGDRHWEFRNAVSELVQSLWAGWPVSGPRMNTHCIVLAHHSRFVQLSGLLPWDLAAQEHELLCRAIELGFTFGQLRDAELSRFELLARRLQMLEMKLCDKVAGSLFRVQSRRTATFTLEQGRLVGSS